MDQKPISFREAVDMAKEALSKPRYDEAGNDLYTRAGLNRSIANKTAHFLHGPRFLTDLSGNSVIVDYTQSVELSDPELFEAYCEMLAQKVEAGESIPVKFRELVAGLVRRDYKVPHKKTGTGSGILHSCIAEAVAGLVKFGLTETRNYTNVNGASACDAVAVALGELGLSPLTHSGVKGIWLKKRNSFTVV